MRPVAAWALLALLHCVSAFSLWPKLAAYPYNMFHPCPLRRDPVPVLRRLFAERFRSQDVALETLVEAVDAWNSECVPSTTTNLVIAYRVSCVVDATRASESARVVE